MESNGAEMRSISETEADEPSRGRRIFQQKNTCDEGGHGEAEAEKHAPSVFWCVYYTKLEPIFKINDAARAERVVAWN